MKDNMIEAVDDCLSVVHSNIEEIRYPLDSMREEIEKAVKRAYFAGYKYAKDHSQSTSGKG